MPDFFDKKRKKTITLPDSSLVNSYRAMASGATISMKSTNSKWQQTETEIGRIVGGLRARPRNLPLGAVITKPNTLSFLLETVWNDKQDTYPNGDITFFEETSNNNFSFERLKPSDVKKRFPAWHPYHTQPKDYLK